MKAWRKIFALSLAVLVFSLSFSFFSCGKKVRLPRPDHIFILIIDALRPDRLGCYGHPEEISPHIDALARRGLIFEKAYSTAPWTKPSVASLFTSLYPNVHQTIGQFDVLPENALTLAERLKAKGYFTGFFNGGNPLLHEFNYDQGFDYYSFSDSLDSRIVVQNFSSFLDQVEGKNIFAYIHLNDTHLPYHLNDFNADLARASFEDLQPGHLNRDRIRRSLARRELSDTDKAYLISLYEAQVRYADEKVGELIATLEKRGMVDRSMILLTSDHGEELWDHDNFEHGHSLYEELLRVPLILTGPGLEPRKIKSRVRHVDLLPTILEAVDPASKTGKIAGVSFLRYLEKDGEKRPVFACGTLHGDEKYGLIWEDDKLILNTGQHQGKRHLIGWHSRDKIELYNLETDPGEKNNLRFLKPKEVARMLKRMARFLKPEQVLVPTKRAIDKWTEERLRALGYL